MKHEHSGHHDHPPDMSPANTSFGAGAGRGLSMLLLLLGAAAVAATFFLGYRSADALTSRQALASYHVGFMMTLGISLGAMGFVMILQQTNAGWAVLLRRQVENVMDMFVPLAALFVPLVLLSLLNRPLWDWMAMSRGAAPADALFEAKRPFLNVNFFLVRAAIYFGLWLVFSRFLFRCSVKQDVSGDKWLTARARKASSYGLLVYALTTAFAAFDWTMSLDHHWYSTMFGVYYFSGNMGAALAFVTLLALVLRRAGKLQGLVTGEHLHDMGKLLFAFSVFWAYIGFSQYFLIWYANIPEETAWFIRRRTGEWMNYSIALAAGRFIVPFIILMPRPWRRSPGVLAGMSLWILGFNALDLYWQIRPQVLSEAGAPVGFNWLDIVGAAGPVCLWLGILVRKIASGPLVPLRDPRLHESLHHKNYV